MNERRVEIGGWLFKFKKVSDSGRYMLVIGQPYYRIDWRTPQRWPLIVVITLARWL